MSLPNLLSLSFLVPFVAAKNDFSRAIRGLRGMPRRLLLVGHRGGIGTLPLGRIMTISSEAQALELLREGSMLMRMWRAAKANADVGLPIDVIALAVAPGAVAATGTIQITNTAGALAPFAVAGELAIYIGGERVAVSVTTLDTQATVATKLIAAVNAMKVLPVTASTTANTNECLLTCRWGGATGNQIGLASGYYAEESLPSGLTLTLPDIAGGTLEPDVSAVISAMDGYRATEIVTAFTDSPNMLLLEAEMAKRWAANNMQDGTVVNAVRGSEAQLTAYCTGRNSAHVHTICVSKDLTSPWETAAMAGAVIESQAAIDPALPHTGLPLLGYRGPKQGQALTLDQINNVLTVGGSPLRINPDSTGTLLRMVTNYRTTPLGAEDRSMAELAWIKTMSYYRWFHVTEFQTKYQGYKLAQYVTDQLPGQKIMTPQLAEEAMLGYYKLFMDVGLTQNMEYYRDHLVVEIDAPNGKLKILDEPVIITQHYQTEITSFVVAGQV